MAFTDPQTVTVNAVAKVMARVRTDGSSTEYALADESYKMRISHQVSKNRTRRMVRIDNRVVATDPLSAVSEYKTAGIYLVIDEPEYGFADADLDYIVQGLKTWLSTANVLKILGNES